MPNDLSPSSVTWTPKLLEDTAKRMFVEEFMRWSAIEAELRKLYPDVTEDALLEVRGRLESMTQAFQSQVISAKTATYADSATGPLYEEEGKGMDSTVQWGTALQAGAGQLDHAMQALRAASTYLYQCSQKEKDAAKKAGYEAAMNKVKEAMNAAGPLEVQAAGEQFGAGSTVRLIPDWKEVIQEICPQCEDAVWEIIGQVGQADDEMAALSEADPASIVFVVDGTSSIEEMIQPVAPDQLSSGPSSSVAGLIINGVTVPAAIFEEA